MQGSALRPLKRPPGLPSLARAGQGSASPLCLGTRAPCNLHGNAFPTVGCQPDWDWLHRERERERGRERRSIPQAGCWVCGVGCVEWGGWCGVWCVVWCVDVCSSLKAYRHVALNVQQPHSKHECRRQGTLLAAPGHQTLFTFHGAPKHVDELMAMQCHVSICLLDGRSCQVVHPRIHHLSCMHIRKRIRIRIRIRPSPTRHLPCTPRHSTCLRSQYSMPSALITSITPSAYASPTA
jgi:hypothetical protein